MVHYENLPDEDKDTIIKATEEFQKKCLLSYNKTRDSTIIQKFPLPRVLLHGQTDTVEAKDRRFFIEAIDKSVRDAISSRNEAFADAFHNAMKEAIHGIPVGQVGLTCYNILDLLTQGLIKSVPVIKKQHQLIMVASRHFKVHLNKLRVLQQIRYNTILDH